MKKIFASFLFFALIGNINAQVFFKAGWAVRSMNMEALDIIIDSYNDSRTWLDQKMSRISYTHGYTVGFGSIDDNKEFALYHIGNWRTVTASGTQPGNGAFAERTLHLQYNQFQMPVIWYPGGGHIGVGASFDVGYLRFKSKVTGQTEYSDLQKELKIGSSFLLKYITSKEKPAFSLTLSLQTSYFSNSFYSLDYALNPVDSYYVGEKGNPVQIGLTAEYYFITK